MDRNARCGQQRLSAVAGIHPRARRQPVCAQRLRTHACSPRGHGTVAADPQGRHRPWRSAEYRGPALWYTAGRLGSCEYRRQRSSAVDQGAAEAAGADPNVRGPSGKSALHIAVEGYQGKSYVEVIQLLVRAKADVAAKTRRRQNAAIVGNAIGASRCGASGAWWQCLTPLQYRRGESSRSPAAVADRSARRSRIRTPCRLALRSTGRIKRRGRAASSCGRAIRASERSSRTTRPFSRIRRDRYWRSTVRKLRSTISDAMPVARISPMIRQISRTISGASPSVASSRISTSGLVDNARPIASICCSPPESCWPPWLRRSARRGNVARMRSSGHSLRPVVPGRAATSRFSRTERFGKIARPSGNIGDAGARNAIRKHPEVAAANPDAAARRTHVAHDRADQRRLAHPVASEQPDRFTRANRQRYTAQHMAFAVMHVHVVRFDEPRLRWSSEYLRAARSGIRPWGGPAR